MLQCTNYDEIAMQERIMSFCEKQASKVGFGDPQKPTALGQTTPCAIQGAS